MAIVLNIMENALIVVLLSLLFLVVIVLNLSTKLRSKIKIWQYITFAMAIGILVMIFTRISDMNDWQELKFEGEVIKRVTTKNHALVEFTIKHENDVVVVLDEYWKMSDCEVGDRVLKQSGDMLVSIEKNHERHK